MVQQDYDAALIVRIEVNDPTNLDRVEERLWVVRNRVLREALRNPSGAYGLILRRTAAIRFIYPNGKVKEFRTARTQEASPGVLVSVRRTRDDAWRRTLEAANQALNDLFNYVDFARIVEAAQGDRTVTVPDHPTAGWARFVKPLFGDIWKGQHQQLVAWRRRLPSEVVTAAEPAEAHKAEEVYQE